MQALSSGDTAWVLICTGLVLFMTPGLALFYGGMVRQRNTLVMLQQNIIALGVVSLTWVLLGYTIAFGDDAGSGLSGNLGLLALTDLGTPPAPAFRVVTNGITIPALAFVAYQMMFAVITPALATGSTAGRLALAGWAAFLAVWSIVVYPPIAHWLWHPDGWLASLGAQDWAGGMVVHASAGAAALALLLVVGRRRNWPRTSSLPNAVPLAVVGAGILWFGWFGFNGGDGLRADGVAAQAVINTHVAAAAAMLVWLLMERIRDGHGTVVGAVSGAVAGLATITPCAGFVSTMSALAIGAIAGFVCQSALRLKFLLRVDDALDVLAVHFVGGMLGSVLLGFFAQTRANRLSADGLFFGGGPRLLGRQVLAVVVVVLFSFLLTWIIATVIQRTIGLRVPPAAEGRLDQEQQGLEAYHLGLVPNLPGRAAAGRTAAGRATGQPGPNAGSPAPGPAGGGGQRDQQRPSRLITGLLDPERVDSGELTEALVAAGAGQVVISSVHVHTKRPRPEMFRGVRRDLEFDSRIRVEVLARDGDIPAVLDVFNRFSPEPDGFVQSVEPGARARLRPER